jgi:nondiscriminating aspartyl-tRNA synthetase
MKRTLSVETIKKIGQTVLMQGWISARRNMGKIVFIDLRDRAGLVQVVLVPSELDAKSNERLDGLRPEFVVEIKGVVNERGEKQRNPSLATGNVEVLVKELRVLAAAETLPYELGSELHMDAYLENLPFNLRAEKQRAIFKVQSGLVEGFRKFMLKNGFIEFQSPQFYKQIMAGVYERVFAVGNVYRAEEHDTSRHINEYTSLDFEMGFIKDYREVMKMVASCVGAMFAYVGKNCSGELKLLNATLPVVPKKVPAIKLKKAQKILEDEFEQKNCSNEPDLEPHQERLIGEYAKRQFGSDFIFITHYPVEKRPMYTFEDPKDKGFTASFDLLFRGTEIVTGGQRINEYEKLKSNMIKFGLNPENFQFYLQAFKYGMPPEGGIGMGLERVTWQLLGLDNIKQATLFPRDQVRIDEILNKK